MTDQLSAQDARGRDDSVPGRAFEHIAVSRLTGTIGAEVSGVQLAGPIPDETAAELRRALVDHLVLFIRDQPLSDDQHIALARVFGQPNVYPATRARGLDVPLEWIEDTPDSPPKADLWHTDAAFLREPPDVGIISMLDVPPVGGDTLWLSLYALYDALSPSMKVIVNGLDQDLHPGPDLKKKLDLQFGPDVFDRVADEFAGARHPLVRVHPISGRPALFMCGAYVRGFSGMSEDESRALLTLLRAGLNDPNIQCRWRWSPNDVAIWDERCTNHRGLSDHFPAHRLLRRCTTGAGSPSGPER
jgi:taurine dioxygenase